LFLLLALGLTRPARATPAPPAPGRSLNEVLNPDGTLRPGANGSFDARAFRMETMPDGRPVFRPAGVTGAGDERWADGFGMANGPDGGVSTIVQAGTDVYIGGGFTAVENVVANGVAKWNGRVWTSLGTGAANGVHGTVAQLAVAGNGDVYVGGYFDQAGGAAANNVARWNGSTWSALGIGPANGVDARVTALATSGGNVYVSGYFGQAGSAAANRVAKWNGTAWSPLGTGFISTAVSGYVYALAVSSAGDLYAAGTFDQAGGVPANNVARWNGTAWSALGTGTSGGQGLNAVAVAGNGDVYVGGYFTQAGGVAANNVAKWNGSTWNALGTGAANGVPGPVSALATAGNGDVYVGGGFDLAGGNAANRVAKWNGSTWSALGTGAANGLPGAGVNVLAVAGSGEVYVGGGFPLAGGVAANNLAKWNGSAWIAVATGPATAVNGVNGSVYAVAVAGNGDVYVGGIFSQAGGVLASNVAKWNGTAWSALGAGVANSNPYLMPGVYALAVSPTGEVYAGGGFDLAGGVAANNVAKWNGTAWAPLGTGAANGVAGGVNALAVAGNGDVYAVGYFTQAGGVSASQVARWNGTAWSGLGSGITAGNYVRVMALAVAANGDVYVGGQFAQAGTVAASNVARWNGTAWSPLGAGTGPGSGSASPVAALAIAGNGDVYVGGSFTQAGGGAANYVAKWNGTAWSPLGVGASAGQNGSSWTVLALTVAGNGDVYVGGDFTQAGGMAANRVAKWNSSGWSALGTGVKRLYADALAPVYGLAVGATGKVYAGGAFTTTGDGSKAMAHFAIYDPTAPLAATAARATPASLFPNPAHGAVTLRLPAGAPRLPLTLTDAQGRTVRRYPAPATAEAALDLRGLPVGAYVVRCGEYSQRLVVE
jgi:hypothetical protein